MCTVCGISTAVAEVDNVPRVLDMLWATRHRGPDACGIYAGGISLHAETVDRLRDATSTSEPQRIVIGQSRLTITGSSDAKQPLTSSDGKLALAHNGEIYNYETLDALLPPQKRTTTGCDSDVLMSVLDHHYRATGEDLAEAVRRTVVAASGMYALAAADESTLVLARDAIGKKPLYYVHAEGTVAFASERKALSDVATALGAPISPLRPGEMLVHRPGSAPTIVAAERLAPPAIDVTEMGAAVAAYEHALMRSMARRTRGLKRAAVFFSGGVDSVLVARLLQRLGVDVHGYVVGAAGASDVEYAVDVAKEMGLPVTVTTVDEDSVALWLPKILEAAELHGPMMAEVSVPMWFAAKAAHEDGHRVVFTGQAADELFAGYDWYRNVLKEHGPLTLHARLWEDIRALPVDTLEREDRISMAWSLEMRAPFLDADVIRTAMRITPTLKLNGPDDLLGKRPHRMVAVRMGVPERVAYRTKVPAQDGASIHTLLDALAAREEPSVQGKDVPDFGSNYRYRDAPGSYGSPRVRAMLASIAERGGFVVAGQDGLARVPPVRIDVKAPATRDAPPTAPSRAR